VWLTGPTMERIEAGMDDQRPSGSLRRGWTTGACAAAAAKAAYVGWVTGAFPDPVEIELPGGARPGFALALTEIVPDGAKAGVVRMPATIPT
jgi:cobalt-precorrin-5B (C1)-methyltransferase